MLTEKRNANSTHIDRMTTLDVLSIMNAEDAGVAGVVRRALPDIAVAVDMIVTALRAEGRLFYIGAGTSGRLGVLDASECIPTFNTDPEVVQGIIAGGERAMLRAVEGAEDNEALARQDLQTAKLRANDVVVGITASGRTPYVKAALQYARDIGAGSIAIACNEDAPVFELADCKIALPVGPEVVTGSTRLKAGTAQKMVLNMLSTASMIQIGKVYQNLMVDVQPTNIKLVDRAQRIIMEVLECDLTEAADLLEQANQQVKVAIVMGALGIDQENAQQEIQGANGHLSQLLPPKGFDN